MNIMTEEYSAVRFWKSAPDRDQALDTIYSFLRALSQEKPDEAMTYVFVKDMPFFQQTLHDTVRKYLELIIEDEQWEEFAKRNLAFAVSDPVDLNEDETRPEFGGRHFVLENNETVSVLIGIRGDVTPIRLHFMVVERDELYYLRLFRITVQ